jgi:hypothetical protein
MISWRSAIYGGIGGAFVPIFSEAQNLVNHKPFDFNLGWFVGLILLFSLGAILANASKEKVPLKALAIGISLPATINGYLQQSIAESAKLAQSSAQPVQNHSVLEMIVTSAQAQGASRGTLVVDAPAELPNFQIVFYGPAGTIGGPVQGSQAPVAIPAGASSLAIHGPEGWSLPVAIPASSSGNALKLRISVRSGFVRGFKRSFGASDAPYEIEF